MADIITDSIEISSGVISSGLSIGMNGEASVLGGTVTDAEAFDGGFFWVEQGGYVSNASVYDYGELFIDGGRADNITLATGGQIDVYDGVMHTGTLLSGGVGIVYAAGSGLNIAVSSGGSFLIYGGFTADTVVADGGYYVMQTAGGQANDTVVLSGGHARVVSGAKGSRSILRGGRMDMLLGYLYDTTISSGGRLEIMSGQAYNTDILEGGSMLVSRSGDAYHAVLNGGKLDVHSGVLYDAEISAGSAILRETLAERMTMEGGSVQAVNSTLIRGAVLNGGVLSLGSGTVVSGGTFNLVQREDEEGELYYDSVTLIAEAGAALFNGVLNIDMSASSGVTFSGMTVNACTFAVEAGAIVAGTTVSDGGTLSVLTSASVANTTVAGGTMSVLTAASVANTSISNGLMTVGVGAIIAGTTVSDGGTLSVLTAATLSNTTVNAGGLFVLENGTAQGVLVSGYSSASGSNSSSFIISTLFAGDADGGDVATSTSSGGEISSAAARMLVSSGGLATNVVVSCGTVGVSGGLVSGLTMDKGEIVIGSGGIVRGAVLKGTLSGGNIFIIYPTDLTISTDTTTTDPTYFFLTGGGGSYSGVPFLTGDGMSYLTLEGGAGGAASGEVVVGDVIPFPYGPGTVIVNPIYIGGYTPSMGFLTIESGGLLEDAEASAMQITVSGGGLVRNLSATSNTWVTVSSGGTLTGRMSFVSGTTVTVESGGIVDFDLSALAPGNQVLLTGTGNIKGAPLYTITVSAEQAAGRYVLADGASSFTGTLTVRNTDWGTLGTLTVGELTEIGGRYYLARAKNDYLSLQIWTEEPTILPDPEKVYLNTAWSELEAGTVVSLDGGGTATVGYDAFAGMDAASEAVAENGLIVITGCDAAIPGAVKWNVEVAAGASVTGCTVASQGRLTLKSGASARDVAVSGGTLTVEDGATLTVTKFFTSSGTITVNGTFNIDISGSTGSTDYYLNAISTLNGAPTFTVTVGGGQANGAYRLIQQPVTDNKDFVLIIVDGTGAELGTVALRYTLKDDGSYQENRTDAVIDGKRYSLRNLITSGGTFSIVRGIFLTVSAATDKPSYVYVDASWSGYSAGDTLSVRNPDTSLMDSVTFGTEAFAMLEEAVAAGDANCTITIYGGTFSPADGLARNTFLNGGVIENTTVSRSLTVNGGLAKGLTVEAGGSLTVNGGTVSGAVFGEGSAITVKSGTFLFDVTALQPDGAALYSGLSFVSGSPDCVIYVSADQAQGVYTLGANAAGFSVTSFTLCVMSEQSGRTLGTLTVGETYREDGIFYTIAEADGALTLTVGSYEIQTEVYVNSTWNGLSYGDAVTLSDGTPATLGVDAFATLHDAFGVVHSQGTVYLDGGTFSLADMNVDNTRKTVARAGSVVTGEQTNGWGRRSIDLTLESGATADSFKFEYGTLTVNAGARLTGESRTDGGSMVLYNGAILDGTLTVNGLLTMRDVTSLGGVLVVGGTMSGTAVFTADMNITVNGWIGFDITGSTAGGPALFRGLSFVKGTPYNYYLEISSTKEAGVYALAEYASRFTGSITVRDENNTTLGRLSVGSSVLLNGRAYTLTGEFVDDSYVLSVSIEDLPPAEYVYVNNSAWSSTTQVGTVVAVPGGTAIFGYDAFFDLKDAFSSGASTICITGGVFTFTTGSYKYSQFYHSETSSWDPFPDIVVSGASLSVNQGGDGGSLNPYNGCISVIRNGYLEIRGRSAEVAVINVDETGTLSLMSSGWTACRAVSITVNGALEFDLTGAATNHPAQDLSVIQGTQTSYAIKGAWSLNSGIYKIASNSARIGDQIDLVIGSSRYTLDIGGDGISNGGKVFAVYRTEADDLMIRIESRNSIYVNSDWKGLPNNTVVHLVRGGVATVGEDAYFQVNNAIVDNYNSIGVTIVIEKGDHTYSNGHKPGEVPVGQQHSITLLSEASFTFGSYQVCGGRLFDIVGGRAVGAVAVAPGGTLTVTAGGSLTGDLTVFYNSTVTVDADSTLTGRFTFMDGADITVDGQLRFSIADMNAGAAALHAGLARYKGTGTCVLTLGRGQKEGVYALSSDVTSFTRSITVENSAGVQVGTVSLGETLQVGSRSYTLSTDVYGNLNLTVVHSARPGVVHLDSSWDVLKEGDQIAPAEGVTASVAYDAFDTIAEAYEELAEGGTLVVWGGTHSRTDGLGCANSAIIRSGELRLSGTLGEGRTITVCAGGTLYGDLVVSAGATITVEAGGTLSAGHITVEAGANVTVEAGAALSVSGLIDFRLLGVNPDDGPLFRGLSLVQGAPSFSLTIDRKDTGGIFVLASGVGQFDGVLTVRDLAGTELGTLAVGDNIVYGNAMYILTNSDAGDLTLIVTRPNRVNVNSDWAGLEDGTTVVLMSGGTATIGYDAFAYAGDAFSRVAQDGAVIFEKGKLDSLGTDVECRSIIVIGDLSIDSFTLGSGITVTVGAGGRLSGFITVEAGGALTVEAGGTLSVSNYNIMEGASVWIDGTLDFDMTNAPYTKKWASRRPAERICLGYDFIRGNTTTYSITVSTEWITQKHGTKGAGLYALADSVSVLFNTFTVLDVTGEVLGTFDAGTVLYPEDRNYKLMLTEQGEQYGYWCMAQNPREQYPYVNSEWEGLEDGSTVYVVDTDGDTIKAVIGKNAFATYAPAAELASAHEGWVMVSGYVETDLVTCTAHILAGGTLSCGGSTLEGGGEYVAGIQMSGGTLENVVIDCGDNPGRMMVSTNGYTNVIRNFTMRGAPSGNPYYSVKVNSFTTLTGFMTFEGGGFGGGTCPTVDFDLSVAVESRALAINLDYQIAHTQIMTMYSNDGANYTITVEDKPAPGTRTYWLASTASSFGTSRTITVKNRVGDTLGTISVGGSLKVDDVVYRLYFEGDSLMLKSVSSRVDVTPPTITVTASFYVPTNQDVVVTAQVDDDGKIASVLYRIGKNGEWTAYDDSITVSENTVLYFKATDESGNESEVVSFTVNNIDKVAPDAPANLRADVAGHTVTLSWDEAADDASGVEEYVVKYRTGDREYTVKTTETNLVLKDIDAADWSWNVQSIDAAGNASGASDGGTFAVTDRLFFTGDFDGSGKSSFAMADGGLVTVFGSDGLALGTLVLEDGWTVAGAGDFDGDGMTDLIRVNADGYVVGEFSRGDGTFESHVLNLKSDGWDILGIGDFDGDGADDVLIANPTGASDTVGLIGYWKGGTEWTLINGYSASWELMSTGDFDGDGKCDMLWRNSFSDGEGRTYNAYCTWITEPASGDTDWRMVSVAAPDEWNFLCSGDFDGDKTADIAMINNEGVVGIWGVKDGWLDTWSILSAVDTSSWSLVGVGDFNGDGTADIAWRNNETGLAGCWQIENKELASWQSIASLA